MSNIHNGYYSYIAAASVISAHIPRIHTIISIIRITILKRSTSIYSHYFNESIQRFAHHYKAITYTTQPFIRSYAYPSYCQYWRVCTVLRASYLRHIYFHWAGYSHTCWPNMLAQPYNDIERDSPSNRSGSPLVMDFSGRAFEGVHKKSVPAEWQGRSGRALWLMPEREYSGIAYLLTIIVFVCVTSPARRR